MSRPLSQRFCNCLERKLQNRFQLSLQGGSEFWRLGENLKKASETTNQQATKAIHIGLPPERVYNWLQKQKRRSKGETFNRRQGGHILFSSYAFRMNGHWGNAAPSYRSRNLSVAKDGNILLFRKLFVKREKIFFWHQLLVNVGSSEVGHQPCISVPSGLSGGKCPQKSFEEPFFRLKSTAGCGKVKMFLQGGILPLNGK